MADVILALALLVVPAGAAEAVRASFRRQLRPARVKVPAERR